MFEEIPARPQPPSEPVAVTFFGVSFALFLGLAAITWIRWSSLLSLMRKFSVGECILCGGLSGVFLLTAKSASPESNRKRMAALYFIFLAFQIVEDLLR